MTAEGDKRLIWRGSFRVRFSEPVGGFGGFDIGGGVDRQSQALGDER
jgi:hypothetical protein